MPPDTDVLFLSFAERARPAVPARPQPNVRDCRAFPSLPEAQGIQRQLFNRGKPFGSGRPSTSSGTPPLAQDPPQGAAHLGAGGHGDVQVAEDVLRVLVLHRLAQERQGPSRFSAAVPHLSPITQRGLRGAFHSHEVGRDISASPTF